MSYDQFAAHIQSNVTCDIICEKAVNLTSNIY